MSETQKKEYKNAWLTDSVYIKNAGFQDTYYLESLCYHINSFLKNTPIPVVSSLDEKNFRIEFSVGYLKRSFKINVNYSYFDFITLVKGWLIKYYPQYTVEYEVDIPLSDKEILDKVKTDHIDLNDAIHLKKKQKVVEHAIIEKVIMKEDKFILNKNGKRYFYIAGTIKKPQTLSEFKKALLLIKDDAEKKKFIDDNSTLIKEFDELNDTTIEYQGQQMLNFFKINFGDLKKETPKQLSPFVWKFGRFVVKFSSEILMSDCLKYFNDRMSRN